LIPSSKKTGKYERQLFDVLMAYFEKMGFKVFSHVQLNLSWGNIISDIDVVAMSEKILIGVEVKSSRDNLKNVTKQIDKMMDFFDGIYVASDKPRHLLEENFHDRRVGLLFIDNDVRIKKECQLLKDRPRKTALTRLRKTCLERLAEAVTGNSYGKKGDLASNILLALEDEHLRLILKSIVTCNRMCDTSCPIQDFEREIIVPLRKIRALLKMSQLSESRPLPLLLAEEGNEDKQKATDRLTSEEQQ
jgi:Holliday junction resolvase